MRPTFRSHYDEHERVPQNPGDPVKIIYSPVFDKDGNLELKPSGKENLYDFIQSHAESCDIHVILERFARGDISALSKVQGTYGDFTTIPKTYADLLNAVIQGEAYFMSLPVETRAKFDHDFHKWMAGMDDMPSWMAAMGLEMPSAPPAASTDPVLPEAVKEAEKLSKDM